MSEFGLKIKNIEAGTLFEYNLGVRDHYEYREAMFPNSLFSDYLKEHGLKIQKDSSTRDIICLEFNFGSRSYQSELEHLYKIAAKARREYRLAKIHGDFSLMEKARKKGETISSLLQKANKNRNAYTAYTAAEVRTHSYQNGVNVTYVSHDKKGNIKDAETFHYKMLYRSAGKAKKGSCMFIVERLYKRALHYLRMGIKLSKTNPMLVEISAYSPFISSTMIDKIKINPENILILKDIDWSFTTKVIRIETDSEKHCHAKRVPAYELKNTLFDGQALIDSRLFPAWGNGYLLLRHHFCKMAAFSANIQTFFKDYFKEAYETATVTDMFGIEHFAKDIELITTNHAMKWLKFGKSYAYWCKWVHENGCRFGIVKTAHPSKLGEVQKMSYQMINALNLDTMEEVTEQSVAYIHKLKSDPAEFLKYLERCSNFSNDYDVLLALCRQNPNFIRSSYFRRRKEDIIKSCIMNFKSGKVLQNADNLVIVGSPYAMLLYAAAGQETAVEEDHTFSVEEGAIQCYTERFEPDEYLAEFRSPFNGRGNMGYLHNVHPKQLKAYLNPGRQVIAVNMIGTDFQDRNNGSDQDSDSIYVTNLLAIVRHARDCYSNYPTIVNDIPKDPTRYQNTMEDFARIDQRLAASQALIGESSNLAQLCLTYSYNDADPKYEDYVCTLSVLAQCAIDNAKRQFDIDLEHEIKRIKKDMKIREYRYPSFWLMIKRDFDRTHVNEALVCPMNYLYKMKFREYHDKESTLPMSDFSVKYELDENRVKCKKVEELIQNYSLKLYNSAKASADSSNDSEHLLLRSDFDELIRQIRKIRLSQNYLGLMSWLIDRAFLITPQVKRNDKTIQSKIRNNKAILLKVLYEVNPAGLLKCFSKNSENEAEFFTPGPFGR
ncbi:MAG: hypothetical protein HFE83_11955 [Lachnospiraceae bacterium]|nr:hypothetical protein [Lachnospiraceae bacterium]